MDVMTFDPKKVLISIGGREISGYADGTFINIEAVGDGTTLITGADSTMVRNMDPTTAKTATLTVLQASKSNDDLSTIYQRDKATGAGMVPFLLKDGSGRTRCSAGKAFIVNEPAVGFSKSGEETREWTIILPDPSMFVGGNN